MVGINVDGKRLTAGMAPIKLFRLVEKTRALLGQGFATGKQIERLVGSWSWAFSVFSSVYRFCESAHRSRFQIWPSVNRELSIACALAPLLSTSLASPWFPKVIASDASTLAQGVCAAPRSVPQLRAMANTPPPQVAQKGIPIDRSLHRDLQDAQWSTIVSAPFARKEHINVLELRALRTAVWWVASSPVALGSRVMSWVDSLVVMYGVRKGRFSSFDLLGQMRPLSALLLAMDMSLTCNWIPTDHNPADAPSRDPLVCRKFDSTLGYPGEGPFNLLAHAIQPPSKKKYKKALRRFLLWLQEQGMLTSAFISGESLDMALVEWFNETYVEFDGRYRGYAVQATYALIDCDPSLRPVLFKAQRALKA